ncbi:hypothetical protein AKO1_009965 [Acrasis kona]|uniref:Uncharacterized protein n=1 Tax=Acrasis kona TaxID=1008807 RepID=A0AAW2ZPV6_9EUKA
MKLTLTILILFIYHASCEIQVLEPSGKAKWAVGETNYVEFTEVTRKTNTGIAGSIYLKSRNKAPQLTLLLKAFDFSATPNEIYSIPVVVPDDRQYEGSYVITVSGHSGSEEGESIPFQIIPKNSTLYFHLIFWGGIITFIIIAVGGLVHMSKRIVQVKEEERARRLETGVNEDPLSVQEENLGVKLPERYAEGYGQLKDEKI